MAKLPSYEYTRHRKTTTLNEADRPAKATHVAVLSSGIRYFVRFDEAGTCWIQPSKQYGTGYAFCSLFQKDCTFIPLSGAHHDEVPKV